MSKFSLLKRWYIRHRLPGHTDWATMLLISAGWAMLIFCLYKLMN